MAPNSRANLEEKNHKTKMSCYVVRNPNDQNKMLKVNFKKKSRKLPEHTQS